MLKVIGLNLKTTAYQMMHSVSMRTVPFDTGGDEFAVISFEDAEAVAGKMDLVNLHLKESSREYVLQICCGVYRSRPQEQERRVFELADSALYEARHAGKGRSVIYRATQNEV